MGSEQTSRLLAELRGQHMTVPDLSHVYRNWKSGTSPHYGALRAHVNESLERVLASKSYLKAAQASDFALFTATWFPFSDFKRLKFMAMFIMFLFLWDDAIDREGDSETPGVATSLDAGEWYLQQSTRFVEYHLGLGEDAAAEPEPPTPATTLFVPVGETLRKAGDAHLTKTVLAEMKTYFGSCRREQASRLDGKLPTVDEYWEVRLGTSAVFPLCALAPYMMDVSIPPAVQDGAEMRAVWKGVNMHISVLNDVVSLKKEIADGVVATLIPITMNECKYPFPDAVSNVVAQVGETALAFDRAIRIVRDTAKQEDGRVQADLERVVDCLQTMLTGCFHWHMATPRYGVKKDLRADGSLLVSLATQSSGLTTVKGGRHKNPNSRSG